MLRKVLIIIILILVPGSLLNPLQSFADLDGLVCLEGSRLAKERSLGLLDKVQSAYARTSTLQAEFTQESYLSALELSEQSSGQVWFLKPGKMRWNYKVPDEQTFLVDDQTLWFYQKEEAQLQIDNLQKALLTDLPVSFLLGLGDLTRVFRVESACKTSSGLLLELMPREASSEAQPNEGARNEQLAGFDLLISESSFLPLGARVKDVAGNITSFLFKGSKFDVALKDALFKADCPRGIDIIDNRESKAG